MIHRKKLYSAARCLTLAAILPLLYTGASYSAENSDDTFNLGEVVVTAKTGGVEATQVVHVVTAEDIQAKNARTLNEAIDLLPGLNVRNGGDGVPRIDIRGLRTRHIVLMLDGIPMNSAVDQQFDPTTIPVENIAKIKLTTGPSSVLYGQGGLAGVINIITKKGTKDVRGGVSYEVGDRQEYLVRANVGGSKDRVDFFLSGSAYHMTSFPLSDDFVATTEQGSGYRGNSDHERNNIFGNLGFQATKDLNLALTLSFQQGEFGKPASVIPRSQVATDPFANNPKYQRMENFEGFSIQAAGDYSPSGPFSLRTWAYHNRLDQHEVGYDDNTYSKVTRNGSFDTKVKSRIQGLTMQPKYDFGQAGILTASFTAESDKWENSGFTVGRVNGQNNRQISADLEKGFDLYSLSAQYEVEPVKNLGLVFGYGHYWQSRSEMSDNDFSVMAGIHYDIFTDTRLKAAFQRNIRFPTLDDLYSVNGGNSDLKAERSLQYEIGVEQKLPGKSLLSLTGFRTDVKDFIEKDTNDINQNFDEYRFYGVEVGATTRFIDKLVLRASYSYLDSKDKSDNATKDELQYRPKNKVTFEGWYDFAFGLTPYVSVQYVGNQVTYDKDTDTIAHKMNNFTLVNVKLNQKVLENRLNVYFGVNNLFDENYETSYGFPQAGRFIYGGIGLSI